MARQFTLAGETSNPARLAGAVAVALTLVVIVLAITIWRPGQGPLNIAGHLQAASLGFGAPQCDCSQCQLAVPAAGGGSSAAAGGDGTATAGSTCPPCPGAAGTAGCPEPAAPADGPMQQGAVASTSQYASDVMQRLQNYATFLPPRAMRQGLFSLGEGSRMRRFTHKLLSGQPVSVSAVGGSVTAGQGAQYGNGFMKRIWDWIQEVSPTANHTLKHGAFGGSASGIFTVCVKDMVQADADLVIVEFAVNDPRGNGIWTYPERLGFERLLRKLQDFPNRPAVVLLHHFAWFSAGGAEGKVADYLVTAENDFNVLGQYYNLPILSIRSAAYYLMFRKEPGYLVHKWRRESVEEDPNGDQLYYFDDLHPQDRTGHRALADLMIGLVRTTAQDLQQRPLDATDESIAQEAMLPPMIPGNYQRSTSTCLVGRLFEPVVVAQQGFVWKNERPAEKMANQKWGWISEQPGSWAELEVDTSNDLQGDLKPETNEIALTYLKSYEFMGQAKVQCLAGCVCEETSFDGYWKEQSSLTELHRFQVTPHEKCRLRVTVLDTSSSPDGGKKAKLVGVMVVEGSGAVQGIGIQLDMFANRGDQNEAMPTG